MRKIIDGLELAYDDRGSGAVVVLLHGFPLDRTIWDAVSERLSGYARVIRIDLRGSGESACGAGPALMETLAGDVFGLLEALDVDRSIIVGHSMGGYVALAYFRMYAERVAGLGLVASQVGPDTPARARLRDAQVASVTAEGTRSLSDTLVSAGVSAAFAAANPAAVERLRSIVARQDPAGATAQIIGMKERVDSADLLDDIRVLVVIIGGRGDSLIDPLVLEGTAAALADAQFVGLPDVAHLPMLEAPDATAAALRRLVERCALGHEQIGKSLA